MKISILTPNLSGNSFGRAYILGKVLQRHYEVEIVGPKYEKEIWKPLRDIEFSIKDVQGRLFPSFLLQIGDLLKNVTGEIIYAHKPFFSTFNIGLIKKITSGRPIVLDIDDWDPGFIYKLPFLSKLKDLALSIRSPSSLLIALLNERLMSIADEITVSNKFLKDKFGGAIVPHGRDTDLLNPERFDRKYLRRSFGVSGKKIVTFLGTPRQWKGIEDLIEAVSRLKQDVLLMLVGLGDSVYDEKLRRLSYHKLGKERAILIGQQPFGKIGDYLSMSDLIVIPQHKNAATKGQLPAKVFDAMAMAKPVIVTNVSDLPQIIDGCGWIVEPGDSQQLVETISYVFKHPVMAEKMGNKARKKCVKYYSYDAMEKILIPIFNRLEHKTRKIK